MACSAAFGWADPEIDGVLLSGMAFVALFVASFWVYASGALFSGVVLALVFRRWRWSAAGGLCALVVGVPMLAGGLGARRVPADTPGTRLTVMSMNLLYGSGSVDEFFRQVDEIDPDVLVLQEYTDAFARVCESELLGRYPHAVLIPSGGAFGQATFSRLGFVETPRRFPRTEIKPTRGWPAQTEVMVRVGEREVSVVNVHLLPPTGFTMVMDQHRMASGLVDAYGDEDRAIVLAGDFNSNERGLPVRRVLRSGFESVFSEFGVGLGATWPRTGLLRHLPGTRLDHVLYRGARLRLLDQGVGGDFGSDHRPVWATFLVDP